MATAQCQRCGTSASAHPDPDPDPELRIKSVNSVPDPSVPDHQMQYLKSDVELSVRSIPVPYLFHTRCRPNKVFSKYSPCIIVGTSKHQSSFHTLLIKYAIQTLRIRQHRNVHSGRVVLISMVASEAISVQCTYPAGAAPDASMSRLIVFLWTHQLVPYPENQSYCVWCRQPVQPVQLARSWAAAAQVLHRSNTKNWAVQLSRSCRYVHLCSTCASSSHVCHFVKCVCPVVAAPDASMSQLIVDLWTCPLVPFFEVWPSHQSYPCSCSRETEVLPSCAWCRAWCCQPVQPVQLARSCSAAAQLLPRSNASLRQYDRPCGSCWRRSDICAAAPDMSLNRRDF